MHVSISHAARLLPRTLFVAWLGLLLLPTSALAVQIAPSAPSIDAKSYVLVEFDTGKVLVEQNAHEKLAPASLTKIMTAYVVAAEIASGRLSFGDQVQVSVNAWQTKGSRMFINEGSSVSVHDLLQGIIVSSGNDASVAIAEHLGGSEKGFADLMNQYADALSLESSSFRNSTGLDESEHYATAYDHAMLSRAFVRDYPDIYSMFKQLEYEYNDIKQPNRNRLLTRDPSVDGVKTGFTDGAGYNLVASAERNGMRLFSVVLGAKSPRHRENETLKLLNYGFRNYRAIDVVQKGEEIGKLPVYYGEQDEVHVVAGKGHRDVMLTHFESAIERKPDLPRYLEAPLSANQEVGRLTLTTPDDQAITVPLVVANTIEEVGLFARIWEGTRLMFSPLTEEAPQ